MITDLFFRTAGFFVLPGFLSQDECTRLRREAGNAPVEEASVVRGPDLIIDRSHRSTKRAQLPASTEAPLIARLEKTRHAIESHFGCALREMQPLQPLVYGPGDFFAIHSDSKEKPDVPDFLKRRRVSVVMFLGHEGVPGDGEYGGLLQFHGLIDDPRLQHRAYAFAPEVGTLLAFRSHVLHEVTPVQKGVRYSLVTWFC
jgi:SM-20-related protein